MNNDKLLDGAAAEPPNSQAVRVLAFDGDGPEEWQREGHGDGGASEILLQQR
jgi:hypothetical protein